MNRESGGAGYTIGAVNLLIGKALAATLFRPVPEVLGVPIGKIIDLVPGTKEKQQEGNSFLLLEFFHEAHLVCVDIRQWKGIGSTFFGIEADGNPLYDTDIIDGTFLIEIGQSDVAAFLLDLNRLNGSGNFLDQCQNDVPRYFSMEKLISSSSVEPRSPRVDQVAMAVLFSFFAAAHVACG